MRLVTSCVRLACDIELLSNNRHFGQNPKTGVMYGWATTHPE